MARRGRRRPVAVGEILARLLDEQTGPSEVSGTRPGAQKVGRVLSAFGRIGAPIGDHAEAIDFRRGVLTLQVHQSAWLTELTFLRSEIIERINKMVPGAPVKDVRLRLGPRRRVVPPPSPPRPLTPEEQATVDDWISPIADDAVKEAVRRAAARSVARGSVAPPQVFGPPGPRMIANTVPTPPPMKYGYGAGGERAGWTKDRWKTRKSSKKDDDS